MKRGSIFAALLALLGVAAPAAARWGFPNPVTQRAEIIEGLYAQIAIAGIIVFVFVMALMAFILIRFRDGGKGRATFEIERDNLKAEMVWTIIPLIIMLWIGVISYQGLVQLDNLDDSFDMDSAEIIDITASQYAWQASYDSGVQVLAVANPDLMSIDAFYVPADTPLLFRITGVDVIHSFNVPALGTTVDAVPGQINELFVHEGLPAKASPGYFTQCRENCLSPGHSYMHARIISVPQAEFDEWTEDALSGAGGPQQVVPLFYDGATLAAMNTDQIARGATARIQILNDAETAVDFTFNGQTISVMGKGLGTFDAFPVVETGTLSVTGGDATADLFAVEAERVSVNLGAFIFEPNNLALEAGTLYMVTIENVHNAVHNLYIGMDGADGKTDAIWNTGALASGQTETIIIYADEAGNLDMWCSVSGHYSSGMYGTVTIA
jgi:heme/copper-type cytochrome/quinol oxidase subunit 2